MGRQTKWTDEKIARLQAEGRGKGTGDKYKPWIQVSDLSSLGNSRRVYSQKTGRVHHLLSDVEWQLFLLLEFAPDVTDIREQYPLAREDTLSIAAELRIKLKTLIKSLGGIFYEVLISDRSERRVLTFALSNTVSSRVEKVIRLGVENGYLYESYIGSKDGRSQTKRYVLTRRVAPYFKLDPTGFSGYLFVSNELLELAIEDDVKAVNYFCKNRLNDKPSSGQASLFGEENHAE